MGVGVLGVGEGVGNTVTTMIVVVGLAVGAGGMVKVGKGVDVGDGWTADALVGVVVGEGRGIAVGLGSCVVGVWAAMGVGSGGWMSTGKSPSASTKAATTVRMTAATARRLVSNGRHGDSLGFCVSVELLAIILLALALVRPIRTQVQGGDIHFHPGVIVSLADGQ